MEKLGTIIGTNLTFLRKKAGLTQLEFGEKFNYSDRTVSKWELGDIIPSVEVLKSIADFYGVTVDFILKEHASDKDFFSIVKKVPDVGNKITVTALIVIILYAIAVTIHIASIFDMHTSDMHVNLWWTVYMWMVPVSALIIAVSSKKLFKSNKLMFIWISVAVWTILISAFVTAYFTKNNFYWYLFFIGVPVQIAIILMMRLRK